jgi:hypothetical protein
VNDRIQSRRDWPRFLALGFGAALLACVVIVIVHSYILARESNHELEELRAELSRLRGQLMEVQRSRSAEQQAAEPGASAVSPK